MREMVGEWKRERPSSFIKESLSVKRGIDSVNEGETPFDCESMCR